MNLSFCSISALDRSVREAAEVAAGCGLDGLEITGQTPHFDPDASLDAARAAAQEVRAAGVDVVAYGSYLGRFGQVTRAHAEKAAAIAEAMETKLLRVWAEPTEDNGSELGPVVDLMRAAADAAAPAGITVVIERHLGSFADTPTRIEQLFDAIDRPNVALNYQVLDFLPTNEIDDQAADAVRLVPLARYFHLKNYQLISGDGPLFPGGALETGILDYRAILKGALKAGYRGPMTIEFLAADERPVEEKLAADVRFVRTVLAELGVA